MAIKTPGWIDHQHWKFLQQYLKYNTKPEIMIIRNEAHRIHELFSQINISYCTFIVNGKVYIYNRISINSFHYYPMEEDKDLNKTLYIIEDDED